MELANVLGDSCGLTFQPLQACRFHLRPWYRNGVVDHSSTLNPSRYEAALATEQNGPNRHRRELSTDRILESRTFAPLPAQQRLIHRYARRTKSTHPCDTLNSSEVFLRTKPLPTSAAKSCSGNSSAAAGSNRLFASTGSRAMIFAISTPARLRSRPQPRRQRKAQRGRGSQYAEETPEAGGARRRLSLADQFVLAFS